MTDATDATPDAGTTQGGSARAQTTSVNIQRARAGQRGEREAKVRRSLFVASLAGFVAVFGLVAITPKPARTAAETTEPAALSPVGSSRVLAEVPIADPSQPGDGRKTIVRIVAPTQDTAPVHIRTRATG